MRMRVLVVEDNEDNLIIAQDILTIGGFDVLVARNGADAVHIALRESPDVIWMDLQLPVLDGYEATRRIRAAGLTTPIVAVTSFALPGDEDLAKRAGCTQYVAKPYSPRTLLAATIDLLAAAKRG